MRGDGSPSDVRQLLSQRADILSTLLRSERTKGELTDTLDVSRSTIDRGVRQLESTGLVRRSGGTVTATLAGRLAYDSYRQYCEETAHVVEFGDLLAELPPSAEVSHEMLDGATAYRSEPPATGRPANEITALIAQGTRMRACASAINDSAAADQFYRMITERGGQGSVVYTSSLAEHLREEYFQPHHEMAATGRFRAFETDSLPHELYIIDSDAGTTAGVLIYNDSKTIRGTILNDTDAAVEWARETFEDQVAAATEFTDDFRIGGTTDEDAEEGPDGGAETE
ncbi:helix-turn-helix transcriptional regulator [Salinigranum halophilum]|uniref:helix-turn-helix transcriptional regulator n=1 Tax=Salinigranum halophilum TaxID=2565931 RepID=UPI00115D32C0|nr:ArsR family transcriptional regulator [Salinigranum halophilum]